MHIYYSPNISTLLLRKNMTLELFLREIFVANLSKYEQIESVNV